MDTDFPMFRLADVYLMYAEAVFRGGTGGDKGTAIDYLNDIMYRAYRKVPVTSPPSTSILSSRKGSRNMANATGEPIGPFSDCSLEANTYGNGKVK